MNIWVASCNFTTQWLHKLYLSRKPVTLSEHHSHLNWNRTLRLVVYSIIPSLKQISSQVFWHIRMLNVPVSRTSDLKNGIPLKTLPGAWRYRVKPRTGFSAVNIMQQGETVKLIRNFCLSGAACLNRSVPEVQHSNSDHGRSSANKRVKHWRKWGGVNTPIWSQWLCSF